jgi:hypothetical protein
MKADGAVTVYDYFEADDDDLRGAVVVVLTEDQTTDDMAKMLLESFGVDHCAELAAALARMAQAARMRKAAA